MIAGFLPMRLRMAVDDGLRFDPQHRMPSRHVTIGKLPSEDIPLGVEGGTSRFAVTWQRVQLARHPLRPFTLDYVTRLVDGFRRAARRSRLPRRRIDRRRRPVPRPRRSWCSATRRAAAPRRTCTATSACRKPEGYRKALPPDAAGRANSAARFSPSSTRPAPIPASTPRSAARPKPSPRTCAKWRAAGADHRRRSSAKAAPAARSRSASAIAS